MLHAHAPTDATNSTFYHDNRTSRLVRTKILGTATMRPRLGSLAIGSRVAPHGR